MSSEAVVQLVRDLAAQLGVAAEHLWGVMIKQAIVGGVADIIWGIVLIEVAVGIYVYVRRFREDVMTASEKSGWPDPYYHSSKFDTHWGYFAVCILLFIFGLVLISFGIEGIINPEYFAFTKVLNLLPK